MVATFGKLTAGTVIGGRYRVDRPIGEGGAGMVFAATDLSMGRLVAIKVLRPAALQAEGGVARFRREAELAQRLTHPNTIRVLDYGQDAGLVFIVFELLRGTSLEEAIARDGPVPFSRFLDIVQSVLKSLMEAHAAGVVHRDIKPSNIFLCDASQGGVVKVLDFGVARVERSDRALTEAGDVLGTPRYMAPEQVRGEAAGPETDLYALGLVALEALTGTPVYADTSAVRVCIQQVSPDPVPIPPSVLCTPLAPLLLTATAKDRTHRYPTAAHMFDALSTLTRAPALTPPLAPALAPAPPRTLPLALALALALALLAFLTRASWLPTAPSPRRAPSSASSTPTPLSSSLVPPPPTDWRDNLQARVTDAGWKASALEIEPLDEGGFVMRAQVARFTRSGEIELYQLPSEDDAADFEAALDAEVEEDVVRRRKRNVARASIHGSPEAMAELVRALLDDVEGRDLVSSP